jgi:osmoprotectant transport system permease protein
LDTLKRHPELRFALEKLGNLLNNSTMQKLNYAVDEEKRSPKNVARKFLLKQKVINQKHHQKEC